MSDKIEWCKHGMTTEAYCAECLIVSLRSELDKRDEDIRELREDKEKLVNGLKEEYKSAKEWNGIGTMNRIEKLLKEIGVTE